MDMNHVFRSGKYVGKTISYVYSKDKRYFNWVLENRPEMLKSHNKKQKLDTINKPYKKPIYVDPPDLSDKERGIIKPASISDAFDLLMWWIYIVECSDKSLYTGITTDINRRIKEHNTSNMGAKYTRSKRPVFLVYKESCETRSIASKREYVIKKLTKKEKLLLVSKYNKNGIN